MPPNDVSLTSTIAAGESMVQESHDTPAIGGETPSINNEPTTPAVETEKPETQTTDKQKDEFVSGSRKARMLGESRRKLASMLITAAKDNQEIRESLKKQIADSPDLDKYLQKNWKKDYEVIFKDRIEAEYEGEQLEAGEKAKVLARAEILIEQLKEEKEETVMDLAARLGFTTGEAKSLKDLTLKLEGQVIGDEELNFEEALKRAAYTIRPDKSKVGITSLPAGIPDSPTVAKEIVQLDQHDKLADLAKRYRGAKKTETMENLKIVEKGLVGNTFNFPMD